MPELTLSQQMTMTPQDYFDIGFLAGARAMQEAAIAQSDQFSEENGPGDVGDRHGEVCQWAGEEIAAAIRALDPEKVGQ